MSKYWPSNFDLKDTSNPLEILESARKEWDAQSRGALTLVIQEAESVNKNHLLIVHAKHVPSNRTATLFSVVHRLNAPYPARIQPKGDELPDLLKKSYYQPGFADIGSGFRGMSGGEVTNPWVCDTPAEFRTKLEDVFNLGSLKSDIFSLVSGVASSGATESIEIKELPDDAPEGADS